jgi:hypothetical protein
MPHTGAQILLLSKGSVNLLKKSDYGMPQWHASSLILVKTLSKNRSGRKL